MPPLPNRLPPLAGITVPSTDEFYRRMPPAAFVDIVARRHRARRWTAFLAFDTGAAMAAIAIVAVLSLPGVSLRGVDAPAGDSTSEAGVPPAPFGAVGQIKDKGTAGDAMTPLRPGAGTAVPSMRFDLWKQGAGTPVAEGQELHEGDVLRFTYESLDYDYVYLFSVDEWGRMSSYYPDRKGFSVPIVRGRGIPLPGGVMLDDFVGFERFYAIFSDSPLGQADVQAAAGTAFMEALASGRGIEHLPYLPIRCPQATILIQKR